MESIERGVHLIPKFGNFEKHHYKHFFFNSWSDPHIYNFIW